MAIKHRSPEAFFIEGDSRGILLVHGFTGSAAEMGPMGRYFHEKGFTVHAPLLVGHGTTPDEMRHTTWQDWYASVAEGYKRLEQAGCEQIYVAGLSMGGALSLLLAKEYPVNGVISMAAPIKIKQRSAQVARYMYPIMPFVRRKGPKPPHIEDNIVPYDRTPVKTVASLGQLLRYVSSILPEVKAPILIAQGKRDETIDEADAQIIYDRVSSPIKSIQWYEKSSHIIVLDVEREKLFTDIYNFINSLDK